MEQFDAIDIAVSPAIAFAAIADLPAMGRRSPENTGGTWVKGATGPARGAIFRGTNAQGDSKWTTTVRVALYDPPHRFAFDVRYAMMAISRWEFTVESIDEGCRVSEKWRDRRNFLVRRAGEKDGFSRADFNLLSIRTTLERLKQELESSSPTN